MVASERDPKSVPIHIEFGSHDEHGNLAPLREKLEGFLESSLSGKVIVFMEDAYFEKFHSLAVSMLSKRGQLPSHSYKQLFFIDEHNRPGTPAELDDSKMEYDNSFINRELEILDEVAKKYPGRILLLPEWSPEDDINLSKTVEDDLQMSLDCVLDGRFEEALPYYKRGLKTLAESASRREGRIAEHIESALADEPDSIALVGQLGSAHFQLIRTLRAKGISATKSFTTREEGRYFFDPGTILGLALKSAPDKEFSDEQWYSFLIANTVYDVCMARLDVGSEQQIARASLLFIRKSKDEIEKFKKTVTDTGDFFQAIVELTGN